MVDLRRAFVCVLLACASCDGGPTSDWPHMGAGDDDKNDTSHPPADGGVATGLMDAAASFRDAGKSASDECLDAGSDAGDASCESRDE